ncbi:putative cation-transporting ATPase 13A4 isoform 2-T2 [Anomaloglossus baeobatrachus]|uniref:putative cation-transporting ATPase 13A4 isoform X2 n=1 Tax=Anomaloglossus baeobatrachus TaxID=238106 RepID=UPI003F4F4387
MGVLSQDDSSTLLNKGQDNEMEIFGYRTVRWQRALCIAGYIFSFGLLWLIFYWKPEWEVWACCTPCTLQEADVVLLRETDEFKRYCRKKVQWTNVSEPTSSEFLQVDDNCIINKSLMKPEMKIRCIWVQKIKYVWLHQEKRFQKAGTLDDIYSCSQIHLRFGSGLSKEEQNLRRAICGPNAIEVEITPVWKLLFKEVFNPYYLFQAASLSLWLSEGYIEYSIVIIVITVLSIILTVYDLRQQSVKLNRLVESNNSAMVTVHTSDDGNEEMESRHLVPGDLLVLSGKRFFLPCDCILLRGSCIVNEGMLTGESIPVTKTPLDQVKNCTPWKIHSGEDYKGHVLFCGTEVIQTTASGSMHVTAVVMQTGFNTAKGDMVRSILYPKPMNFKLYQDASRFLMCLIAIAVIGFIYSVVLFAVKGGTARDVIVKSLIAVTVAIPPVLPAAVATAIMYAQKRLKKKKIFCLSPQRINVCGRINLVCFDKTGTLTEDGLDLWGVVPSNNGRFQQVHMFTKGNNLPWCPLLAAMTCCHSLMILDGKIQGDPMDLKMFEGTNWDIDQSCQIDGNENLSRKHHLIVKPGMYSDTSTVDGIIILQQFPFSSSLQRMAVISQVIGSEEHFVFMKGAPEMVKNFCTPESVPENFCSELQSHTTKGFRVIGMAYKIMQCTKDMDTESYTREEVESDLLFLGLLILENRLKPETIPVLKDITNALIRTAMITGDNLQTAITVARNSGIVQKFTKVILIEACEPTVSCPASITWRHVENADNKEINVLLNGAIFARMSPNQKSDLIEEFQKMDYYVAMCGDGANDCGALKVAHAGISLSEQEASVASPFTSQTTNIQCVPELIKEGRAALVSSFAVFKYVTLYAMIQFICLLLLYWQLKSVGLYQYLIQDVGVTVLVCLTMSLTQAYPKLAPYRPPAQLISPPLLLSVMFNILFNMAIQICAFVLVQKQPWYSTSNYSACAATSNFNFTNGNTTDFPEYSEYENYEATTLWSVTTISCVIVAFVFSKGKPFRKPIYTNYIFFILQPIQLGVCIFILFADIERIYRGLQLVCTPTLWRVAILILLIIFFLVTFTVEESVIENRRLWLFLKRLFKYKSSSKYRELYRALQNDPSWPPVTTTLYANVQDEERRGASYSNPCYKSDENGTCG